MLTLRLPRFDAKPKTGKPPKCVKGMPCGNTCISKIMTCKKAPEDLPIAAAKASDRVEETLSRGEQLRRKYGSINNTGEGQLFPSRGSITPEEVDQALKRRAKALSRGERSQEQTKPTLAPRGKTGAPSDLVPTKNLSADTSKVPAKRAKELADAMEAAGGNVMPLFVKDTGTPLKPSYELVNPDDPAQVEAAAALQVLRQRDPKRWEMARVVVSNPLSLEGERLDVTDAVMEQIKNTAPKTRTAVKSSNVRLNKVPEMVTNPRRISEGTGGVRVPPARAAKVADAMERTGGNVVPLLVKNSGTPLNPAYELLDPQDPQQSETLAAIRVLQQRDPKKWSNFKVIVANPPGQDASNEILAQVGVTKPKGRRR